MQLKIGELQIMEQIGFNYEELKAEITQKAEIYKNMVYTEDTIKEAKQDRANLNNFIKVIENERKRIKKQWLKPYEAFEKQIKDLISIIQEPVLMIDGQVKEYEEKEKTQKHETIKELFATLNCEFDWLEFEQIYDPKWLNKSVSIKKIEDEINIKLEQVNKDIKTIKALTEFTFEAMDFYKKTLNLNGAITEGQRLLDLQKRKEEQARLKEEEARAKVKEIAEAQKAEAEKEESEAKVESLQKEPTQIMKFECELTLEQARALAQFCKDNNIIIKRI